MSPQLSASTVCLARRRRSVRRYAVTVAGLLSLLLLAGCSGAGGGQWSNLGLPGGASSEAPEMRALWIGAWIAAGVVGVFVWGLIFWVMVRFRQRRLDEIPVQVRYNLPVEVLYTAVPFVIIFVFFFHTVKTQNEVLVDDRPDHEILVVGQQWSWSFNYLGDDGRDEPGATDGNDVFEVGTPSDLPTLMLPVNQTVKFSLRSPDVIHSFWIPSFYFKQDVIPGRTNQWTTTPTIEGSFAGKCAELCGISHSRMLFEVEVVSEAEYQEYLDGLAEQGNNGVVVGSTETDEVVGLESEGDEENGASP